MDGAGLRREAELAACKFYSTELAPQAPGYLVNKTGWSPSARSDKGCDEMGRPPLLSLKTEVIS